jgi:UTP-glucose-1-phosphate uridylyltransferase
LEDIHLRPIVQEEPLGLGHAVNEAADVVGDRPFFCLLADNIVRPGADVLASLGAGSNEGSVSVVCLRQLTDE